MKKEELGDALRYVEGGPTAPAKAAEKIEVHPEFSLSLVAAEPLIAKAMNIDWDERGRLWVSETPEYPNGLRVPTAQPWRDTGSLVPARQNRDPQDTIAILSDTNGDGVMDRKHVFADKLELVTGFVFYKRGVIAATAPDIWYLEDTNGDEVADKRTKLYTGLGIYDTHAVINNLRWGLDGWVYATHGYSVGMVTSPDGTKNFGRDSSGVVRFKPDGSAFEQFSSRGGNTWGLDITWDGQVFWTQPTSGTVFFHTVLPESVLAKGRLGQTTSWKGMITGQQTFPRMSRPEQAYVQIDQVGQFTAAAGCAIYDGGAWPDKWRYSYFTGEPTLNLVHHEFVKPDGVSYTAAKETGREQAEFMRSGDMWFRPIETRVGPDGALYVVDFYNQAVIHNDTRGTQHGPANAAVRPDRDHYFGRIWRVQHKQARRLEVPQLTARDLDGLIRVMETSPNAHVKATAWRLAQENFAGDPRLAKVARPMGSQAMALYERSRTASSPADRKTVLDSYVAATDNWTASALIAAATEQPTAFVTEALSYGSPEKLPPFVAAVVPGALPADAGRLLQAAAAAAPAAAPVKAAVARAISRMSDGTVTMDAPTTAAVTRLLKDREAGPFAMAIAARWDKRRVLAAATRERAAVALRELANPGTTPDRRVDLAAALLVVPSHRAAALKTIGPMLVAPDSTPELRSRLALTLGDAGGKDVDAALISVVGKPNSTAAFDQLMRRPESARALLAALKAGSITTKQLGPASVARLRTHPNRLIAQESWDLLSALNPGAKHKDEVIAALTPEIEKPGDAAKGRTLYTSACATCHRFGALGKVDVGPPLNGMGAHGRSALLSHIIDPNREVDPTFWQWNVTTKRGDTLSGVIASENASTLVLRSPNGDVEIKKEEIATRDNTRLSLMPEGLEALGADVLRDILTFIAGDDLKFRVVDLRNAYNADSRRGLRREDERDETVALNRFGDVTFAGVPFFVMDPARSATGMNFIALKGGPGTNALSEELPRRVEVATSATAASLHVLGGVGGWAWPTGGDQARGVPVMKVIAQFADGTSKEFVLKNGEHIADAFSRAAVPLSTEAVDFTRRGQIRYFALDLGKKAPLAKIVARELRHRRRAWDGGHHHRRRPGARSRADGADARSEGRRQGRRAAARDETHRLGARQDQGAHHRRRQRAQLRQVLRRDGRGDADRGRLLRQLHRGPRPGGRRAGERRRCRRQRQSPALRHACLPEGAVRFRGRGQGPRDAAPGHVVRLCRLARAERGDRRRRRARPRSHREILGRGAEARAPGHEGRSGILRRRGRAVLRQRRTGEGPRRDGRDRRAGRDLAQRSLQEAAPIGLDDEPREGTGRRHRARA